jgi:hypothetical protein
LETVCSFEKGEKGKMKKKQQQWCRQSLQKKLFVPGSCLVRTEVVDYVIIYTQKKNPKNPSVTPAPRLWELPHVIDKDFLSFLSSKGNSIHPIFDFYLIKICV